MSALFQVSIDSPLGDFDLSIEVSWDATCVALFGPSGSGKSTIIEVIAGIRRAERARIVFAGETIEDHAAGLRRAPERRRFGWVPQDAALFPHMTVRENVAFGAGTGVAAKAAESRAAEIVEIGPLLDRMPWQLSGGERQRVALARALATRPRALLLDEPFASLDLPLQSRVFPYLLRLRDETALPMIYVTHDAGEALGIARHVLLLERGRLVGSGAAEEVLRSPAALRLLDLIGIENRLHVLDVGEAAPGGTRVITTEHGPRLLAPPGLRVRPGEWIGVRAEDILLAREVSGRISAQNRLPGTVLAIADQEGRCLVSSAVGGAVLHASVTRRAVEELELAPGASVELLFKAHAIHGLGTGSRPDPASEDPGGGASLSREERA